METTGARPTRDRITEIGVVLVNDGKIVEKWLTRKRIFPAIFSN